MQSSNLPVRKWGVAIYLVAVSPKGVSSVRLAGFLGVTQSTARNLVQEIREGFCPGELEKLRDIVEVDKTLYRGQGEEQTHWDKKQKSGRGPAGKTAVIRAKQRGGNVISPVDRKHRCPDTGTVHLRPHRTRLRLMLSRRLPRIPEPAPQL